MTKSRRNIRWTLGAAKAQAFLYETKSPWVHRKQSAYQWARTNGHLEECTKHMPKRIPSLEKYWTIERCKEDALQYNRRTQWQYGKGGGYDVARRNDWLDECCGHMLPTTHKPRRWTDEELIEDARKYQTQGDWLRNSTGYGSALRRGIKDQCCAHMFRGHKKYTNLTLNRCMYEALDYHTEEDWRNGDRASYEAAENNGWLKQCTEHMT